MRPDHPTGNTVSLIECLNPEAKGLKKMKLKNKLIWMIMVFFVFSLSHWLGIASAKEPSKISQEMKHCLEGYCQVVCNCS